MGEFTYDDFESDFNSWNLTQGSVSLLEDRSFLVLQASTTDPFCRGVTLTISATKDDTFAVKSLCNLFDQFPKAYYQPLFATCVRTVSCNYVTRQLQEGICALGYEGNYTGHSFRRGAATSARLAGLSEEEIQLLGRWKSNSYRLYIETHPDWIHNASRRHQLSQRTQPPPAPLLPSNPPTPAPTTTRTRTRYPIPRPSRRQ